MGKTIAVFGAGPGLGLATARRFGREGFRVALVARDAERLARFADELAAEGIKARAFPTDLADRDRHAELVADIAGRLGPIDVAVLNGFLGTQYVRETMDVDVPTMERVFDGLVLAPLSLTRFVLPAMLDRGDGALLYGLGTVRQDPAAAAGRARRGLEPERADPDDLAELYWSLYTKRDRAEKTVGGLAA